MAPNARPGRADVTRIVRIGVSVKPGENGACIREDSAAYSRRAREAAHIEMAIRVWRATGS